MKTHIAISSLISLVLLFGLCGSLINSNLQLILIKQLNFNTEIYIFGY